MKRLSAVIPAALLAAALLLRISGYDAVENLQNKVFDSFQRLSPRPYQDVPVRILDLDDESLKRLGQWPWPRTLVAKTVSRLAELGVSTIAFDIVFSEPDRTSPAEFAKLLPKTPELEGVRRAALKLASNDQVLAKAIAKANVVTGFMLNFDRNNAKPALKSGFAYAGDEPVAYLRGFPGAVLNLPELEAAATGNGSLSYIPERDGVIRRVPLLFKRNQTVYPALSLEALRVAQGVPGIAVKSSGASGIASYGQHTGISQIMVGDFIIPTDAQGKIWVHFTGRAPERTIPVWRIFERDFPKEKLEGAIVFMGTSASGLKDIRTTPVNPAAPGVELHAQAAEQILLKYFLQRPDWADGAEIVYLLLLGLGLIFLLPRVGAAWCAAIGLSTIAGSFALSWHAFTAWKWLLDPLFPSLVALIIYMSSSLISYLRTESEKKQIRGAFGLYLSPALVEQLAANPDRLKLGGEMRNMTFHFCDIRGFTTISEQFNPHDLTQVINEFLTPMTHIIMSYKGTIDKYIGDCIMAFWNAPLDDPEHAANACRAALEMHAELKTLNATWKAKAEAEGRKYLPIKIGTGLNTGNCIVGNLGSDQKFNYSVLGDDVNLASRLEGQSKTYGTEIIIGQHTREQTPDFAAVELDLIRVKGKTVPVRIFALLGDELVNQNAAFKKLAAEHGLMISAYRSQKWDDACAQIEKCRKLEPRLDHLYDLYAERIAAYRAAPPERDWDGVFTATSK